MATTAEQARYRARDDKKLVQVRLSPDAVDVLDRIVRKRGASGRAEILEDLLTASAPEPIWLVSFAAHLLRAYFKQTGESLTRAVNASGRVDLLIHRQ
ncbi:ribbon-helix-helix protein, CopG family [Thiorhodococcus mannitoliphagus]|uniref:Ribbon-helix-helix protein, CopG family n=1 Tax=Thiorhodococcus mannitoliphagus TaxID=329406 RepID=A0A6P1DS61_9GAMM|nr:ribbon-helix-helix protein, CopG family [Thiorhodococcus mannitoliphagus]NEX19761.1 ribbon-helix-helix protein, CopG family [Thiorhodococcus mannitoliphagus]